MFNVSYLYLSSDIVQSAFLLSAISIVSISWFGNPVKAMCPMLAFARSVVPVTCFIRTSSASNLVFLVLFRKTAVTWSGIVKMWAHKNPQKPTETHTKNPQKPTKTHTSPHKPTQARNSTLYDDDGVQIPPAVGQQRHDAWVADQHNQLAVQHRQLPCVSVLARSRAMHGVFSKYNRTMLIEASSIELVLYHMYVLQNNHVLLNKYRFLRVLHCWTVMCTAVSFCAFVVTLYSSDEQIKTARGIQPNITATYFFWCKVRLKMVQQHCIDAHHMGDALCKKGYRTMPINCRAPLLERCICPTCSVAPDCEVDKRLLVCPWFKHEPQHVMSTVVTLTLPFVDGIQGNYVCGGCDTNTHWRWHRLLPDVQSVHCVKTYGKRILWTHADHIAFATCVLLLLDTLEGSLLDTVHVK